MSECTHNCSTCSSNCSSRKEPQDLHAPLNPQSTVKHVIGVVSGKGGVGKSLVTSMLAVNMRRKGYNVAILDADITGPSIPKAFGCYAAVEGDDNGLIAPKTKTGIDVMSVNLLLEDETRPVVWRGPVIAGTVKQFWTDVIWKDIDFMFVDCPPGTGDVPLTVFQSIKLDGIVIVSSPQELVSMIVKKAANMANLLGIPVLGLVENYSYLKCPCCNERIEVFGQTHVDEIAKKYNIPVIARLPIDPKLSALCDAGTVETVETDALDEAVNKITTVF